MLASNIVKKALTNIALLAFAGLACPALASDGPPPFPSDANDPSAWPELGWAEETENFLQVQFRDQLTKFQADWGSLPQNQLPYTGAIRRGDTGVSVGNLRQRLGLAPDGIFDDQLASKITDYRADHGLPAGTAVDDALIRSLNLGFSHYLQKLELNLARLRRLPPKLGDRFLLVDSATQILSMYENGELKFTMRVVVGQASDQTPSLVGQVDRVVLNPYWNVPPDLTQSRYAGRVLRGGKQYLDRAGFEALSDWTDEARVLAFNEVNWTDVEAGRKQLRLRQRPGAGNGMGDIKFMFPNQYGVYLHDTPSKALFDESSRAFSAGCVRVEQPWLLAEWLFGYRPRPAGNAAEQSVNLPSPVPIYITYLTAVPSGGGFDFREDIYDRDRGTD